mmetsp:Transcript_6408/g.15960  ORF Transcript_6408/g.15960 Transcript_6408/m.15960 type:complete len:132 (+) Transcript_6408:324-719(+)
MFIDPPPFVSPVFNLFNTLSNVLHLISASLRKRARKGCERIDEHDCVQSRERLCSIWLMKFHDGMVLAISRSFWFSLGAFRLELNGVNERLCVEEPLPDTENMGVRGVKDDDLANCNDSCFSSSKDDNDDT